MNLSFCWRISEGMMKIFLQIMPGRHSLRIRNVDVDGVTATQRRYKDKDKEPATSSKQNQLQGCAISKQLPKDTKKNSIYSAFQIKFLKETGAKNPLHQRQMVENSNLPLSFFVYLHGLHVCKMFSPSLAGFSEHPPNIFPTQSVAPFAVNYPDVTERPLESARKSTNISAQFSGLQEKRASISIINWPRMVYRRQVNNFIA